MSSEATSEKPPRDQRKKRLWIAGCVLVLVAFVLALVLALVLDRNGGGAATGSKSANGDATEVTSPYDLHELSGEAGPGDVAKAKLVSISLPASDGTMNSYGLSSGTTQAQSIINAVSGAKQVDGSALGTTTTAQGQAAQPVSTGPTLTFMFPDRTTLAFDLYVAQDMVGRDGRFWKVDGDLTTLVQAAAAAHQGQ